MPNVTRGIIHYVLSCYLTLHVFIVGYEHVISEHDHAAIVENHMQALHNFLRWVICEVYESSICGDY